MQIDSFEDLYWNYGQLRAWVRWRTPAKVNEQRVENEQHFRSEHMYPSPDYPVVCANETGEVASALRQGRLAAFLDDNRRVPPITWATKEPCHRSGLLFLTTEVLLLWPAVSTPSLHYAPTQADETRCQKWLTQEMLAERLPRRKNDAYKAASQKFSIGARSFNRAWAAAIKASATEFYGRPGRKS